MHHMHMCVCVYVGVYLSLSLVRYVLVHAHSLCRSRTLTRSARTLANEFDIERSTYTQTQTTLNKGCFVCMLSKG